MTTSGSRIGTYLVWIKQIIEVHGYKDFAIIRWVDIDDKTHELFLYSTGTLRIDGRYIPLEE